MTSTIGPIPTLQARALKHFDVLMRGFLACDTVMVLFLTFGYVSPSRGHMDPAGQLMAAEPAPVDVVANDAVKESPFQVRKSETRTYGRRPDVVYTRAQAVPVPVTEKQIVTDVPVNNVSTPVRSTAVALPLGIS